MAIELKVENYCDNCGEFEPEIHKEETVYLNYGFNNVRRHQCKTTVRCKHEQRCMGMIEYLKDKARKEIKDGKS